MPWLDDMKAVSAAIAQPAAYRPGNAVQAQSRELGERSSTWRATPNAELMQRDMENYYRRAMRGEMSMDESVRQFREKWFGGTPPDIKDTPDPGGLSPYLGPGGLGEKLNWPKRR